MNPTLAVALITVVFTSPFVLEGAYALLFLYQRKFKYPRLVAVFLSNNQVYFGYLKKISRTDIKLGDIYYLNTSDFDQEKQEPKQDIKLIKLGNELHGPEDSMLINRQHILFLERLKPEGQVAKSVEEYKKQNAGGPT